METNNSNTLERIEDRNIPITMQDVTVIAEYADNMVNNISCAISNIASSAVELRRISADVELQCAQLDHAIDCLMLKVQRDIRIYEQSLPILDKQFNTCQARLDRLIDKAMDMVCEDLSEDSISRQEFVMKMIEVANSSLNSLIAKLIPNT